MRQAGVIAAAGRRRARDDGRAPGRRPRPGARARRRARRAVPRLRRPRAGRDQHRVRPRRRAARRSPRRARRPTGCARAPSTSTPCGSSPTRTSTTPASTAPSRSLDGSADAGEPDRYTRSHAAADDMPATCARGLRAPRRPRDLGRRHAGALGRRPAPRCGCSITTRGDKGTDDPDADLDALAALRVEETAKAVGAPRLRRRTATSATPTASSPTTRSCAARSCGSSARSRPEVVLLPRSDRGVLRRRLLQPPRPPRHRVGDARRGRARGGQPALLPRAHRRGPRGPPRARRLPLGHARTELLDRHRRHARAQDRRRCSATPASSPTPATGSATSCANAPRTPAPPPASATPSRSASSPSAPDPPLRSRTTRGQDGGFWRRHSAMARSTSTATMPTPPAPISEPMNVPMQVRDVGLRAHVGDAVADDPAEDPREHDAAEGEQERTARREHRRASAPPSVSGSGAIGHRPMVLPCRSLQLPGR